LAAIYSELLRGYEPRAAVQVSPTNPNSLSCALLADGAGNGPSARKLPLRALITSEMKLSAYLALLVALSRSRHWTVCTLTTTPSTLVCAISRLAKQTLVAHGCDPHSDTVSRTNACNSISETVRRDGSRVRGSHDACGHATQAAQALHDHMLGVTTGPSAPVEFYLHLAEQRMDDMQLLPALEVPSALLSPP
jgi:hypothetical protein